MSVNDINTPLKQATALYHCWQDVLFDLRRNETRQNASYFGKMKLEPEVKARNDFFSSDSFNSY